MLLIPDWSHEHWSDRLIHHLMRETPGCWCHTEMHGRAYMLKVWAERISLLCTWTPNMMNIYAYYLWSSQQLSQSWTLSWNLPLPFPSCYEESKLLEKPSAKRGWEHQCLLQSPPPPPLRMNWLHPVSNFATCSVQINLCTLSLASLNLNVKQEGWHNNCYAQHNMTESI